MSSDVWNLHHYYHYNHHYLFEPVADASLVEVHNYQYH